MRDKYERFNIADVIVPPDTDGFYHVLRARFWAVTDNNEVLRYRGASPQCNSSKQMAEQLVSFPKHPATRVEFIPVVYLPHDCD